MDFLVELLGESRGIVALREKLERLLSGGVDGRRLPSVLIQGETGTGKGLLARSVHRASARARGPFVDVNCAAIPDTMLEAELFGFERGAFTDARQAKAGLFQAAHRGTLFLDEIGLLAPALQAKLLKALEEKTVRRLGSTRSEPVDVWVISATNEDLAAAMEERRFREDLYHRLAVITLRLPSLRERGGDILLLAEHFLTGACSDYGLSPMRLAVEARTALLSYRWPGNVRELSNIIERAALLADGSVLGAADLALPATPSRADVDRSAAVSPSVSLSAREAMSEQLERVLAETGWNISRTAALLGITRNTVKSRMARFGLREVGAGVTGARVLEQPAPRAPRSPSPLTVPRAVSWEPRRLTFVRVCVATDEGGELDSRSARQLEIARDKLLGFGGRIEGCGPTTLLAVFGVDPCDEPALLAGHSALVIRNAARETRLGAPGIPLHIGLHTAQVLVRGGAEAPVVDSDGSRREWSRLEGVMGEAAPGAIVATGASAALLRRRFIVASHDPAAGVYRIEGLWRIHASARNERGALVGRGHELALLEGRLGAAIDGRGQVVDIAGEAGIGKSRLVLELVSSPSLGAIRCLEGRCLPSETQTPFYPLLQIARAACGIVETDPIETIETKVHRTLREAEMEPGGAQELTYLLGAHPVPPEAPGPGLTRRLFTAIQRLLLGLAARRPVLVIVEDLHWIDPTSESCLALIAESIARAAVLLVTTFRPGYRPTWSHQAHVLHFTVAPFSPDDSLTLIRRMLEDAPWSPLVEHNIQARAEGNPLFLEELSLAALERGDGSLPERIPATVEDAIAGRLAGLPPRPRRLLAVASVVGREVSSRLLSAVSDLNEAAVPETLGHLQRADFLYASGFGAYEPTYVFKHALVQETAYSGLALPDRKALHARVMQAMEELDADRLAEQVERLAHHAVLAEDHPRAVRYLLQAGRKAAERSALTEAIGDFSKGLELLQKLPATADRDRDEIALHVGSGLALGATKGWAAPETEVAFQNARKVSRRSGELSHLGPVLVGQWVSTLQRARYHDAQALAEELLTVAARAADPLIDVVAHRAVGMTALYLGEFATVREHLEQGLARYRADVDHARAIRDYGGAPHISCLAFLGRALWPLGYPDQALARNREAVAEAEARGGALSLAMALGMLTSVHQLRGEIRATREAADRSLAHATEWGTTYWVAQATILRSWADAKLLPPAESGTRAELIRDSLEQYRHATGTTLALPWFLTLLAEIHGASGRPAEGLKALEEAAALAQKTGERYHEAEIHRLRGELLLLQGGAEVTAAADAYLRRALDVARAQHAKAWELRAATGLARLLRQQSRTEEAFGLLSPVYEWFTEGFETADLLVARTLLEEIRRPGGAASQPHDPARL
jgi:transcriptional regulator with AAA-type ATPase domain/predicted ATPase